MGLCLERLGLLERDTESAWLDLDPAEGTTQVAFDRGGHPPVDFIARLAALALRGPT